MIILPKILPAIFSYENMKEKWDEDNPDEPYNRQSDLIAGRYALDQWIIRVNDEGKTIGTTGWKEHPTHTTVGGTKAIKNAPQGQYRALADARERQINQSKPLVAAFGHASGDNARWFNTMRLNGWAFVNDPNWEKYKTLIPEEILTDWLSRHSSNMAIRPVKGAEDMAKCKYPDDIVPAWFNILKYLPDDSFEEHSIGEPIPFLRGTQRRFKEANIKSMGSVEHKAFVTEQYLRQVSNRIPTATSTMISKWLIKLNALNLPRGKYWFFGSSSKPDRTHVMIDIINKGERFLDTSKKLNLEGIDKAIVFIGVSKEMVGKIKRGEHLPKTRKFIDLWGKGGVRGLRRSPAKKRRFPKEPVDIFEKWQDVLKLTPIGDYDNLPFKDRKGLHTSYPLQGNLIGDWLIVFNAHYIKSLEDRRTKMQQVIMSKDIANKYINKGLSKGTYWSYINDEKKDHSLVMFDILTSSTDKIKGSNNKLGSVLHPTTKKPITKGIVFHHVDEGHAYPIHTKIDIFFDGLKPDHFSKLGNRDKQPKPELEDTYTTPPPSVPKKTQSPKRHKGPKRSRNQQNRNSEAEFQRRRRGGR